MNISAPIGTVGIYDFGDRMEVFGYAHTSVGIGSFKTGKPCKKESENIWKEYDCNGFMFLAKYNDQDDTYGIEYDRDMLIIKSSSVTVFSSLLDSYRGGYVDMCPDKAYEGVFSVDRKKLISFLTEFFPHSSKHKDYLQVSMSASGNSVSFFTDARIYDIETSKVNVKKVSYDEETENALPYSVDATIFAADLLEILKAIDTDRVVFCMPSEPLPFMIKDNKDEACSRSFLIQQKLNIGKKTFKSAGSCSVDVDKDNGLCLTISDKNGGLVLSGLNLAK